MSEHPNEGAWNNSNEFSHSLETRCLRSRCSRASSFWRDPVPSLLRLPGCPWAWRVAFTAGCCCLHSASPCAPLYSGLPLPSRHSLWILSPSSPRTILSQDPHLCSGDQDVNLFLCRCSVGRSCPTLCSPWSTECQVPLPFTISWSLFKLMSIESVMPSNHHVLCCPLLLLPSVLPSIRIFSSESALHIRWQRIRASASASVLPMNIQS